MAEIQAESGRAGLSESAAMSFLPVVERELRVLSRNRRLYWGRFAAAQVALAIVAWSWFTFARAAASSAATQIFGALATTTIVYCLFAGVFLTADCVSEEKRDGTLGLLFLTDLKGYDVAFGKLAANSLQAVYNLFAIFPVLTIPLLLGGLAGLEVVRVALVLLNTLIFSLTVGLLVSTWSQHDRRAQAGAFALIVLVLGGWPALLAFLDQKFHLQVPDGFYFASPGYTYIHAFERNFATRPEAFWMSLTAVHGLAWLALILSAILIRRVWQDETGIRAKIGWLEKFRAWRRGTAQVRARHRAALLQANPYFWLAARDRLKPYYVLWFLAGCGAFWVFLWFYNRRDMLEQEAFFATALLLRTALKVWLASEAGRQVFDDRRSSALELTLSTPLPVREFLEGQLLALLRQFGPAMAVVLCFDLLGMAVAGRVRFGSDSELLLSWVATIVIFLADVATLAAMGMWLGLKARRFSRAMAKNLFFVLVLPWLVFFAVIAFMGVASLPTLNSLNFVIGIYFVISLLTDLALFLNASGNLTGRFREMATDRFDAPR